MDQSTDNESQPLLQPRNTDRHFLASVSGFVHQLCDCINIRPQMRFNGPLNPPSTPPFSASFPAGRYGVVGSTYTTLGSERDMPPSALRSKQVATSASRAREELGQHDARLKVND
ncbi:hypothetical protein M378DRAFT_626455 [Amanita muscaria Koide BX008]|uniref:Uncharacterized protein n=1 Tax=Amanita muscaria (strain Koide BX008) TaxID=946122 RepID=A0A0C2XN16_AMAMK|nr:hypothetical protein M378DRAFT_626455 [Amanita muscaria Koide BX008]